MLLALTESQKLERVEPFLVRPYRFADYVPLERARPKGWPPTVEPRLRDEPFRKVVRELPRDAPALFAARGRPQPYALVDPVVPQLKKL